MSRTPAEQAAYMDGFNHGVAVESPKRAHRRRTVLDYSRLGATWSILTYVAVLADLLLHAFGAFS